MPKYTVTRTETQVYKYEVEAANMSRARDMGEPVPSGTRREWPESPHKSCLILAKLTDQVF